MKFLATCLASIIFIFSLFTDKSNESASFHSSVEVVQKQQQSIDIDKVVKGVIWGAEVAQATTDSNFPLPITPIVVEEENQPSQMEQLERYFMELFRTASKNRIKKKTFWNKDLLLEK